MQRLHLNRTCNLLGGSVKSSEQNTCHGAALVGFSPSNVYSTTTVAISSSKQSNDYFPHGKEMNKQPNVLRPQQVTLKVEVTLR